MSATDFSGRFVWHDLMTHDVARAREFYAALLGWRYEIADVSGFGEYTVVHAGGRAVAGIVEVPAAAPPHWVGYVAVDELEAALARAEAAGGRVALPITDIPRVGRFAVAVDPVGVVVAPFAYLDSRPGPAPRPRVPGHFAWDVLLTPDLAASLRFYPEVFGWAVSQPAAAGSSFERAGVPVAGAVERPEAAGRTVGWIPCALAPDAGGSVERAQELGGRSSAEWLDVPCAGRTVVVNDPTGAAFGLFSRPPEREGGPLQRRRLRASARPPARRRTAARR